MTLRHRIDWLERNAPPLKTPDPSNLAYLAAADL